MKLQDGFGYEHAGCLFSQISQIFRNQRPRWLKRAPIPVNKREIVPGSGAVADTLLTDQLAVNIIPPGQEHAPLEHPKFSENASLGLIVPPERMITVVFGQEVIVQFAKILPPHVRLAANDAGKPNLKTSRVISNGGW